MEALQNIFTTIKKDSRAKFDESVEIIVNLNVDPKQNPIRILVNLPHGTGKTLKVVSVDSSDVEEMVDKISTGKVKPKVDFDILIATPDAMPKLAKVAKILGPVGCMPNPKNGTVTKDIEKTKKELSAGRIEVRMEQDAPIIHTMIGKISFDEAKLEENYNELIKNIETAKPQKVKGIFIESIFAKSTMGKAVRL